MINQLHGRLRDRSTLGWAGNDGYNALSDDDGDGIYSVTLDFPAGTIEYIRHQRFRRSGKFD